MHPFYKQACVLRKRGFSYNEIQKKLSTPKSTLSLWFKELPLSLAAQKRLKGRSQKGTTALIQRNKAQTVLSQIRGAEIQKAAGRVIPKITDYELLFIGLSLYWAEGYKKGASGSAWKCVDFTNSDPAMVTVMMKFFRKICHVPQQKFKAQLMLHDLNHEQEVRQFWSSLTRIPLSHFMRTCLILQQSTRSKRKHAVLPHGTIHIRIYDVKLFHKIIGGINGMKSRFQITI